MACHIAAASAGQGARRYVATMTAEERSSVSNGIWMCYTHGKLIDTDEARYTIEMLQRWKEIAEKRAKARLEGLSEDELLEGIVPAPCTIQIQPGGPENEVVGNAIHDTCLPELWGRSLADAIRDLVIEIIRNAFDHGQAQLASFEIGNGAIRITDDGQPFDSWKLFKSSGKTGGTLAFQRIVRDFSHKIVVATGTKDRKNFHEFNYIHEADDVLDVTHCSIQLTWRDLKRRATSEPISVHESCRVVYVVLPPFMTISDSVTLENRLHKIEFGDRQFIFVTDGSLSELAGNIIRERFPESIVVSLATK